MRRTPTFFIALNLSLFLSVIGGCVAQARTVVVSPEQASTSVTIYRDPDRSAGAPNLQWLNGYALISEKRRVHLPAGPATIRFENVAGGMIAVSAVVSGLPGGVDEKNRDARLLSPAALLDGSLGNRVHLRRTNRATGVVSEQDAVIRSGPDGAVVLQTKEGVEGLRCSGLPETLVYDAVPDGLTAKPSFAVDTVCPAETDAEVALTYLATGFDWGASYVAKVAADGRTLDLSAWLTVANSNDVLYPDAQLLAVAGKPNRVSDFRALVQGQQEPELRLQCWQMDGTSTHGGNGVISPPPAPPPVFVTQAMAAPMMDMVVTARKVEARQEELGDLKLYRVPVPVEVAPNGLKQVALFTRENVPFNRLYTVSLWPHSPEDESRPLGITLRMKNEKKDGLGLPLPSGGVIVMQRAGTEELLLADSRLLDHAIGEKVEIAAGQSDQVRYRLEKRADGNFRLTVTNATNRQAPVEIILNSGGGPLAIASSGRLIAKDGGQMWAVSVPANGQAILQYRVRSED